jgi:16S rRNA processing protein RimM
VYPNGPDQEEVVIARIIKPRGIRGELACDIETDFPERFEDMEAATVRLPDGSQRHLGVEDVWFHKDRVIIKFSGFDSIDQAKQLVNGLLVVSEADALPVGDDEFFEYQLIGAGVITSDGKTIGIVRSLLRTGGTDLLVVTGEGNKEILIPFTDGICPEVDTDRKQIVVDPPEGLLDL